MSIDSTHFTPWSSLAGGLLIGFAVVAQRAHCRHQRHRGRTAAPGQRRRCLAGGVCCGAACRAPGFCHGSAFATSKDRCRHGNIDCCRIAGRCGNALRLGLHQWSRCIGFIARLASLDRCHGLIHGRRFPDGVCGPASSQLKEGVNPCRSSRHWPRA